MAHTIFNILRGSQSDILHHNTAYIPYTTDVTKGLRDVWRYRDAACVLCFDMIRMLDDASYCNVLLACPDPAVRVRPTYPTRPLG